MAKYIEVTIVISDRSELPLPNGNHEVYYSTTHRAAGVGPTALAAFQAALEKGGGAGFLETYVGIPRLALAQVGMVGMKGGPS